MHYALGINIYSQLGLVGREQGLQLLPQHDVPCNLHLAFEESLQEREILLGFRCFFVYS